eukprot:gene41583-55127_t
MQDAEQFLAHKSKSATNPMLMHVLNELDKAVVYSKTGNLNTNQKLWENYCKEWKADEPWVQKLAENVSMENDLQALGDEWAPRQDTLEVVSLYIYPNIKSNFKVAEIGVGGGRIAREVASHVSELRCYDISNAMLARARDAIPIEHRNHVTFHCLSSTESSRSLGGPELTDYFDFIY